MAGYQVKQDFDSAPVALGYESHKVGIGAETAVHLVVVEDVIAPVNPAGLEKRIEPHDIHSEALDIVELGEHARDVTDSVAVRIFEGRRINLIYDSILQPLWSLLPGLFKGTRLRLGKCGKYKEKRRQGRKQTFHKENSTFLLLRADCPVLLCHGKSG